MQAPACVADSKAQTFARPPEMLCREGLDWRHVTVVEGCPPASGRSAVTEDSSAQPAEQYLKLGDMWALGPLEEAARLSTPRGDVVDAREGQPRQARRALSAPSRVYPSRLTLGTPPSRIPTLT